MLPGENRNKLIGLNLKDAKNDQVQTNKIDIESCDMSVIVEDLFSNRY